MRETIIKKEAAEKQPLIINQLNIVAVDRTNKDIDRWRQAHINAEAVHHPNRSRLLDLYKDVDLDGHLSGIVQKRIDAVLNKRCYFEKQEEEGTSEKTDNKTGKKSGKRGKVDELDALIESAEFRNLLRLIMEQKFWGISGAEFIPGKEFKFYAIPRKHIKPKWGIISTDQCGEEGVKYNDVWNIWILGDNDDLGMYLKCAPYAIWKKGGFADWAQYVELFGQPVRIAKYDAYDKKTQEELTKALNEAGSSLAMMIPKQADFEMMDGKTSNGTGELQERFKNACNQEMSIIVLGNTETTSSSSSSGYAQAKEHGKQQLEITKSDLKDVANALNDAKLLNIFKSYGYPVEGGRFVFEKEADLTELKNKKDIDLSISGKVPIDDDYWYDTYGIPKPDNYDELKTKMDEEKAAAAAAPPEGSGFPAKKGKKPASLQSSPHPSPVGREGHGGEGFWHRFRSNLADFFDPAP